MARHPEIAEPDTVPNGPQHNPAEGLNRRYLLAFAGVAALIVLHQLSVQPALIRSASDAPVINLAGRQRMLSQKMAKEALAIVSTLSDEEISNRRQMLQATVAAWERAHSGLQRGDASLALPGRNSVQIARAFSDLQPIFESMRISCREIDEQSAKLDDAAREKIQQQIVVLMTNEPLFLERMEAIVGLYEAEARARVAGLRTTGWLILSAILGVMSIAWGFVLRPAKQLIHNQFRTISKSEQRYRLLVQKMSDGLAIQDREGVLHYVNDRLCEMVGYARHELVGRRVSDFIDECSQSAVREGLSASHVRGRVLPDVTWTTQQGEKLFTLVSVAPVPDADGSAADLYSVITDITDRKRAEDALRQAHNKLEQRIADRTRELVLTNSSLEREMFERQQAEERMRRLSHQLSQSTRLTTIGEMAAGLAHEINQPLGAITNFAEGCLAILEPQVPTPPGLRTALERISAAALRAGETLRRIHNFVRRGERQYVTVDLARIIEDVAGLCRFEAEAENVTLSFVLASPLPCISGDPIQLQQVLVNLIRNALQALHAMPSHVRRSIVVRAFSSACEHVEVSIADNGEGIDARQLEQVFDAFHTTREDGLGLGLAISRSIVEQHGGRLWAEAPSDGGAVFHLALPGGACHVC